MQPAKKPKKAATKKTPTKKAPGKKKAASKTVSEAAPTKKTPAKVSRVPDKPAAQRPRTSEPLARIKPDADPLVFVQSKKFAVKLADKKFKSAPMIASDEE